MLNIVKIHINGDCAVSIKAIPLQRKNKPRQKEMKLKFTLLMMLFCPFSVFADEIEEETDTTVARYVDLEGVEVIGFKQDAPRREAISETVLSSFFVRQTEMTSIKDLGYTVPNFYIVAP